MIMVTVSRCTRGTQWFDTYLHWEGRLSHYHDTLHMYRSHTRGPAMEVLAIFMLFTQLIVILVMVFLVCFLIRKNNHIEVS